MHACWQNALNVWMILFVNQAAIKGMHLCIWMLQMHNADSPTIVYSISKKNVQHAIIVVKKVILHMSVILMRKIILLQDLRSPNTTHDQHCVTNTRRQDDHQVLMAYWAHVGVTTTILVFQNTGMCLYCCNLRYLHHSIHVHLQQVPHGVHLQHTLEQKTDYGNPCD